MGTSACSLAATAAGTTLTRDELGSRLKGLMVLRPSESTPDARVDDYIKPYEKTGSGSWR